MASGNLSVIAKAVRATGRPPGTWSLLIYGPPKAAKTWFAATIAKVPYIKRVFYFDIENGSETLETMVREGALTDEQAAKVTIYQIPDTRDVPMAMETIMKVLTVRADHCICTVHGKINCVVCADKDDKGIATKFNGQHFNIAELTDADVFILDSGSELGNSVLHYYLRDKDRDFKPGWDEYGPTALVLTDACTVIQRARTNFIVVTHEVVATREENDKEVDKYYPLMGSKNFSMLCAKYFSHVAYLEMKLGLHQGGTRTDYRKDVVTGSRGGWQLEKAKKLDLSLLFEQLRGGASPTKPLPVVPAIANSEKPST